MERKLAHIEVIEKLTPIEGADRIETAHILGWQCVVKKGEFEVGEKVVYAEVDSILPEKPEFEFLRERKFRIKTIKLRKQISQGLVLSMDTLPRGVYFVGQDVTKILGIEKYDPQKEQEFDETTTGFSKFMRRFWWYRKYFIKKKSGSFPKWIQKTDEERIQNMPRVLEKEIPYQITEKLDGQSATYFLKRLGKSWNGNEKFEFGVCSRNNRLTKEDNSSWWTVARKFRIEEKLKDIIGDKEYVVLQGEIIGDGIQGNKYHVSGYDFYAFGLFYPDYRFSWVDMDFQLGVHGIKTVPILAKDYHIQKNVSDVVKYIAQGNSYIYPKIQREGVVIRNIEEGISFKVINPEFLLRNDE